jgi:zinc transport system ATP-binding protein
MTDPALRFENVSFAYGKGDVLENATFAIAAGSVVSVVGPNGGGKTTLLRLVLGLETPREGTVTVLGSSPGKAREKIGYMPQQLRYDTLFPISALEVVLMGRMRQGRLFYDKADKLAARASLEEVGLGESAKTPFASLSGGMRQRVLIARALVSAPELLLFDEPTSMIDAASQESFARTIGRVRGKCTIVIVSHDTGYVSHLVDRVLLVNRTVAEGRVGRHDHDFCALYGEGVRAVESEGEGGGA